MEVSLKRVSLMIREDQAATLSNQGINISGLVRDLIDDHLSDHKVTLSVSEETKGLYDKVVSNTGSTDVDIEVYLREALGSLLENKIKEMVKLQNDSFGKNQ